MAYNANLTGFKVWARFADKHTPVMERQFNFALGAQRSAEALAEWTRQAMMKAPGPAVHPIQWKSVRQRRYYFAMRRKAGLPAKYARGSDPQSQHLSQSWKVESLGGYRGVSLVNEASYAVFVQGEYQQPFHDNTGWKTDAEVIAELNADSVTWQYRILGPINEQMLNGKLT